MKLRIVVVLLLAPVLVAGRDLKPEDAVALALEQNANLAVGSARISSAEGLRTQAGLKPNPRLFIQTENMRTWSSPTLRPGQEIDHFTYLSQVVETGGKRQSRVELAANVVTANQMSLGALRAQVAGRVLTAYWQAVGLQRLARVLAESLVVLDRTVQYHRDQVREGSLPEADLIRVRLEWQQVDISHRNALQEARRAVTQLYREMGVAEEPGTTLTGDVAAVPEVGAVLPDEAVERRADVKYAAQLVQQARAASKLQQAVAKPDPEVVFGYKRTGGFDTLMAGVQINLPVRNRNQGSIAAAAADETSAAATLRAARVTARSEIEALRGEYDQKRQMVEVTLPLLRANAAETSRIADAVYREGASDLLRLLDAERVRIQTETLYIKALIDYRQAAVGLQIALGIMP